MLFRSTNENSTDLYELLDEFTNPETLEGWKCDVCNNNESASKKIYIWRAPNILIIQMKKYNSKPNISFPLELDINKYVSKYNNKPTVYDLYAICNHTGNMNGGHYYSFCLNKENAQWVGFDDETKMVIKNIDNLITSDAYLLFYKIHGL